MRVAFIADEITSFIKDHDSTWSIMQAAWHKGFKVFYAHTTGLSVVSGKPCGNFVELDKEFFDYQKNHEAKFLKFPVAPIDEIKSAEKYPCKPHDLDSFDLIFMRSDPPVNETYTFACQILSLCKKAKIINKPQALINYNEKLSILNFPSLIAPTIVSSSRSEIKEFINKNDKAVIKPLNAMGGWGVFVVNKDDKNINALLDLSFKSSSSLMVQAFIPEISQGDKRIILINGKVAGAVLRVAKPDDHRANLAAGGSFVKYTPSKRDLEVCAGLEKFLCSNGIYLAGVDMIGEYITEINITSPTCLQEIDRLNEANIETGLASKLFDSLLSLL